MAVAVDPSFFLRVVVLVVTDMKAAPNWDSLLFAVALLLLLLVGWYELPFVAAALVVVLAELNADRKLAIPAS